MKHLPYPTSFPTSKETNFLQIILTSDEKFLSAWESWRLSHEFEKLDDSMTHLLPLIYLRMKSLGMQDDPWFGRIKGVYRHAWVKNQRIIAVTQEILNYCAEKNIPCVFLKGIPLIHDIYQDIGARFLGDADFLVPPECAIDITQIMLDRGWHYHKPWMADAKNPTLSIFRVIKATTFTNPFGVDIDIHWNLFALTHHTRLLDIFFLKDVSSITYREAFWKDTVRMNIGTIPAKRLCNEDLLIHVVIHGSEGNNYRTLRWVVDAITIIRTQPINWDKVLDRTKTFGFHLELNLAFRYLSEVFSESIPHNFLEKLTVIPVVFHERRTYYRFTNITHTNRYNTFGNFPLLWYGYWKYEKNTSFFGFFGYIKKSLGIPNTKGLMIFILKKYIVRLKKLFPSR